ncbi:MAG: hypothetical protein ACFFCW_21440 [Candidatus Hodarchaeota archaeon]
MQVICYILLGLGFFIMIIGLLAAGMFMFGFRRTHAGGKSKLAFKAFGIDFAIETGSFFFAIVIGLMMVMSPFVISVKTHYGKRREAHAEEKKIPRIDISELKKEEYTICRENIMIDLRKRKEIGLVERFAGDLSETTWLIERTVKEVGDDVTEMSFCHATSGFTIVPIEKPEGAKWTRIVDESKQMRNPFFELLKGQGLKDILSDLFEGKGRMKTYSMTVPITEGKGQQILYKLKYVNAFQARDFEWAMKAFSADTDVLRMKIAFPEQKPFKSYEAYKKAAGAEQKTKIDNPDITTPGKNVLAWTIRDAKEGEEYFVKWTW